MNVYQLRPYSGKLYASGMALIAAPTFEIARNEYILKGRYGEEVYNNEITFIEDCRQPLSGLHGDYTEPVVICDFITTY